MMPVALAHRKSPDFTHASPISGAIPLENERGKFTTAPEKIRTRRVLVVDDELLIRWSLSESLSKAGFVVDEAEDARTALERFAPSAARLDAVILDLRLPDNADLGLLRRIRSLAPDVPVIIMTAYGSPGTADEALRLGARDVVMKPFDLNRMVTIVEAATRTDPA
jgi:DNA-binding NtrC family response regulator